MKSKHPFEDYVTALTGDLFNLIQAIPEAPAPFGQHKLTRAEQLERHAEIANDPDAWGAIIDAQGVEAALEYDRKMRQYGRTYTDAND
jgi:hypothetical protein